MIYILYWSVSKLGERSLYSCGTLRDHHKDIKKIVIPVILGFLTLCVCLFLCCTRMARLRGVKRKKINLLGDRSAVHMEELPVFGLDTLANATSQFHEDKKLG